MSQNINPFQPMQETGKTPGSDDYRGSPSIRDQLAEPPKPPTDPTAAQINRLQVDNAEAPMTTRGPLQIEELDSYLRRNQAYLFKASPQDGYYNPPPLRKSQMTDAQKAKYIRENGGEAYRRLE
jgi:hypothetical protein